MIEQLLRDRMEAAVTDIRPASRLDEILAGPPGGTVPPPSPSRQPPRRITLLAVAAALVAVAAFTAGWLVRSADRDTTRIENQPATTTAAGSTSTAERARVGTQLTVLTSTLPKGVRLIDETPTSGGDGFSTTLRFAAEPGTFTGSGPYLRISVTHADGFATQWAERSTGDPVAQVQGHDAWRSDDGPGIQPGWTSLSWATGPDELVEIQSKGVADDTVLAIARSVQIHP
ncbi:MAG TPA: hypothetical protein VNS19_17940 [Acidimicrobiales bacterium]|nr:hypothetical protein [Acidimicrobiales bacterium]